jgi:hypothetical protein
MNKEIIKKKKTMYENIIAIHNVLKEKNYIVKFSTNSIFKKISKDNFATKFF